MMTKPNGDVVHFHEWFLSLPKLFCQEKLYCKLWNKGCDFENWNKLSLKI